MGEGKSEGMMSEKTIESTFYCLFFSRFSFLVFEGMMSEKTIETTGNFQMMSFQMMSEKTIETTRNSRFSFLVFL